MKQSYVLEESVAEGLERAGVKLDSLKLENLTQHLGEIIGIDLKPIDKTAIHVPTREDYNTLMKVLEARGWRWCSGVLPTFTSVSWTVHSERTCIQTNESFSYGELEFYKRNNYVIINSEQFYKIEEISPKQIEKIVKLHDCIKELLIELA